MSSQVTRQLLQATAPTDVWAQAVDSTSRTYDLTVLKVNGVAYNASTRDDVEITIYADGNDVYVAFDNQARTINDATVVAAGGTPAYASTSCFIVPKGTKAGFTLHRVLQNQLTMKCASGLTATARIYFSSDNTYAVR